MSTGPVVTMARLLLVEGEDERRFFGAAFQNHSKRTDVQVMPVGGKTKLRTSLKGLVRDPLFASVTSLAVVRDSDATAPGSTTSAATAAFHSVVSDLINAGLTPPPAHGRYSSGSPRVGVFIMPDGTSDGMLESLCLQSVAGDPDLLCVRRFIEEVRENGNPLTNEAKSRAHAWLSVRPEPGKRVGEAAEARYWLFASPVFDALWQFIADL